MSRKPNQIVDHSLSDVVDTRDQSLGLGWDWLLATALSAVLGGRLPWKATELAQGNGFVGS
jgi:hypothetical protein